MKITKKFLSILMATILILSVFPVTLAQASDCAITFTAETDAQNVKVGDTVSVSVNMSEYNNLGALTLYVNYDSTALEILDVQTNNAFGYEEFNTDYGSGKLAYLIASLDTKTVSGTLFTIQFEVLKEGCTEVSLTVDELTDIDFKTLSSSTQSTKIHNYDNGTVTPPTCTEQGYTTYACACGYSYKADETDTKDHNFVNGACTECGEKSVKWKFDEETGTLTIYGTGPMENYNWLDGNRPWERYINDIQKVVIEDGITSIGNDAFADCIALTRVTIPDSVMLIGDYAFQVCKSLTNVTIPDSVTKIGVCVFEDCTSLTSVTIGNGVTSIDEFTFDGCYSLTNVTIGNGVTSIGACAFRGCTRLASITIPDSVTSIGINAFYHCLGLKELKMPVSAKIYNSKYTFYACTNIEKVILTKGTGVMQDYATSSSSSTSTYYQYTPWYVSEEKCTEIIIEDGVKNVGDYAFFRCSGLTSVIIPDSVTTIGNDAFYECESLTSVIIPDSVTSIGDYAFKGCNSLTSVTIGNSVTSIGASAFYDCDSLTSVIIPDSVITIGNGAFSACVSLTDVTIGDGVTTIGDYAFAWCDILTITIPDSVITIGDSAFFYCDNLASVTIGNSVTTIGKYVFDACYSLTDVYYSNTEEKWNDISIDSDNDPLLNARIHCNSTGADTHPFNPVVTPPTCTEQGYTTYVCACGYSNGVVDNYVDATGHDYEEEITTAPTHTENGVMTYTCHCGDTYTETINATGDHFYTPTVTPPTCTEGGFTTYTCVCGDTYVADETSATGHDYDYENGVLVRPTENRNGYYMYFCKNDEEHTIFESVESADYTEYDKAIEKLNEYLADSNLTDEAKEFIVSGCVEIIQNNDEFYEDGIRERRDLIASEQHIIDKVTNELNEHYQAVDSIIASCESGNHDVKEYVSDNNATCTVNGTKRGACYYCGTEVIADDENNLAPGHNIVVDNAVTPTCTGTGLTEGSHCSRCDDATTEQEVVPALGHLYQNGICTVCDYADPDYFVFSVKEPSITKIRNKDGIILHAEIEGNRPEGSYVEWTVDNGNFDKTAMNNGDELRVIANNKGYTTFTATLYDADGNELAKDTVELYSQSGFFDKIGGFFRSLFGTTKIHEN